MTLIPCEPANSKLHKMTKTSTHDTDEIPLGLLWNPLPLTKWSFGVSPAITCTTTSAMSGGKLPSWGANLLQRPRRASKGIARKRGLVAHSTRTSESSATRLQTALTSPPNASNT